MDKIPPTNNLAFQKALASEENKDVLCGFINDFYFIDITEENITLENPYSIDVYKQYLEGKEQPVLRHTVKDLIASLSFDPFRDVVALINKVDFISEMQIKKTISTQARQTRTPPVISKRRAVLSIG